jgi:deoxyribonuclease V
MRTKRLHNWHTGYHKAIRIQEVLRERLIFTRLRKDVRLVAGADVSYAKHNNTLYAGVVILTVPHLNAVERRVAKDIARFPYIPGLLTFREAPTLLRVFRKIKTDPDVVLFDGQGIAHPRRFGLASHMGLLLDLPAVGCAKTMLIGEAGPVGERAGSFGYLRNNGEVIGAVLRTKTNIKPVIVSPGYKITLHDCIDVVLKCVNGYRLPEPIRQAHLLVNKVRMDDQFKQT